MTMTISDPTFIEQPQMIIETPRLILRGAQISDTDDLFDCFKSEEVMRYWDTLPHESPEVTGRWTGKMIQGSNNGLLDFVICLKSEEVGTATKVIGKAGVWHDNEIGFLLNHNYWGKGYALEAVREVLDLAFGVSEHGALDRPQLEDVVADVDPRNQASLGMLKKLGFEIYETKEKTFRVGDEWVDSVYLSLKRGVWLQNRASLKPSRTSRS